MIIIYKCRFCGKRVEIDTDKTEGYNESYGSMNMYVKHYSEKFISHKCSSNFTGVMELVAVKG